MTCGIYKIENLIDHKCYIGQSINIEERWKIHKKTIHGCEDEYNYPLYRAIRLYGLENFDWSIIEECSKEELNDKEKYYIKEYKSIVPYGYNQTFGGQDNFGHPMKLTYDKVEEIRIALKETNETGLSLANRFGVSKDTITSINVGRSWYEDDIEYPIRPMTFRFCKKCGTRLNWSNLTGMCNKCYNELRKENWPDRETLKNLIRTISFVQIGKIYGVTDNTPRKWCDYYGLPRRKSDINKMSDEEWDKL
jgi:group I intron endonuclease